MADDPQRPRAVAGVGAAAWLVQPLYLVAELVAAARARAPYSLLDNTISDLGAVTCTTVPYPAQDVEVCSPAHALVNGAFIGFGLLVVVGAVLLHRSFPRSRASVAACVLWVLAGLSSVATGLVPLDVDLELHALVSTPVFVCQPVALLLHAVVLARGGGHRAWWLVAGVAVAVLPVAVWFVVRLEVELGGLLERLALWPVYLLLPVLALGVLRRRRPPPGLTAGRGAPDRCRR